MRQRISNVRIVGGRFKGLKIPFKASAELRPTSNKSRERLFNWLMNDIEGATCLDMFSGTGALGLEAISRGAKFVYFFEKRRKTCSGIEQTVEKLNIEDQTEIINTDSLDFYFQSRIKRPVDIIFIDPPFGKGLIDQAVKQIEKQNITHKKSILYIELEKQSQTDEMLVDWNLSKTKIEGQVRHCLVKRN